ncbi:UDP-N-acetylenolpyruvoylglucosamine reductase [Sodalis glossinidius str. 'morsitans']|uniref:UDP-N-acetylenolpyruvoylglucosamine reductase n=1 Tax=Sodalis glossinidius (strain morsitans) TaxID=343509 RepID=Q2NWS6_SODGM|nr:UDP-N-acetylenolpyruvoylglucosamine reductase [Sodalis glossinidius str. 'morsitans']CRL43745.1 UDP-N-acetylenolpyruvoylglucosamine reductase [Sodalis glossinidius str. 'morsitans']
MMTDSGALKPLNSFAIDVRARRVIAAYTEAELFTLWRQAADDATPVLVLGGGSNVLFLENYAGTVLLNRIAGVTIEECPDAWHLHVGAGEVWHDLVRTCLEQHMPGLENLALIPGCVGSAPIQNIGAYGVELRQFCDYVDVLQLATSTLRRLSAAECQFGYRDSIFKHALRERHAIVAVGLRLAKAWQPVLTYGVLARLDPQQATPRLIYDTVCAMRRTKLPGPALQGNAGSFFKNPVIDASRAERLLSRYPDAPHYPQPEGGVKLAAGWLIDRCGLKGYRLGGAAVHDKQALVLVNADNATGEDVAALARYVRQQVAERFAVWLEPEVRFIGAFGEVDAVGAIT